MRQFSTSGRSDEPIAPPGGDRFIARTEEKLALGSLRIALRSNEPSFTELQYFPHRIRLPRSADVHYTVNCCNLEVDGPWPLDAIRRVRDNTYRAGRFAAGHYLADHCGPAAYLITRGRQIWIFAPHFGRIVWPFVVKYLLTAHSIDRGGLHLKAAAICVADSITLLVGRGGAGKAVLLTRLCQDAGAQFLSNTHVLVDGNGVIPIPSAVRVRNNRLFAPSIASRELSAAMKCGEFLADPVGELGWEFGVGGPIRNICLLDYRARRAPVITDLDKDILFEYMESFSLAMSIYGLREDVLDHLGGDVCRFAGECSHMKAKLRGLISASRAFYIRCDATDETNLRAIRARLTAL